ncbi:ABC transporter ATP-binding protein [Paradesertivirga mongoliensis]|uniref:ABC transporter ATP-binding protein n=1 Tax=Paradesertivirga mongoliensis TaxID=2100740 RepID=A0ABW4ZPI9_9SPHI|nr:ABC transporter ATP-binding protein [Pedobacter mongoliensis]
MEDFLLHTSDLSVGYKSGNTQKSVAGPLNLTMKAGELICLLGPNGAGKSTLIRTLAGLQPALNGIVKIDTENVAKLKPSQLAKKLSLVLTDSVKAGNLDVFSLVSLGRYPYSGWLGGLSKEDKKIVKWAIESAHVEMFVNRKVSQLSDGECQKVMLARALAQDTPVIILDEPTAHLDLPSRIELMRLLHQLAKETSKGILISTHELDLALQVADQIWLLKKDGSVAVGSPEELVLNGIFESAFDKAGVLFDKSTGTFNIHQNTGKSVFLEGNGAAAFWTKRALLRHGYSLTDSASALLSAEVRDTQEGTTWLIKSGDTIEKRDTMEDFLLLLRSR